MSASNSTPFRHDPKASLQLSTLSLLSFGLCWGFESGYLPHFHCSIVVVIKVYNIVQDLETEF